MTGSAELLDRLPPELRRLVDRCGELAAARGEAAYLVGGGVRDLILDREGVDVDVVVVGDGMALAQDLARDIDGNLTRYHAFQTARVDAPGGIRLDVATARSEEYPRPGELPRVREGDLEEDLARRDFTVNAMAISLNPADRGRLVDPFAGRDDLEKGLIRFLHRRSFADDPTRILRALRFAVRLGYRLEPRTDDALDEAMRGRYLDEVSGARLRREVRKMLAESPVRGPLVLARRGVLEAIDPGLEAREELLEALVAETERLDAAAAYDVPRWSLVLAVLGRGLEPQRRWTLVERLRLSRRQRRALVGSGAPWSRARRAWEEARSRESENGPALPGSRLLELFDDLDPAALVVGLSLAEGEGRRALADDVRRYLTGLRDLRPELDGDELIAMGCPPGPRVGELLTRLRSARADGEIDSVEAERRRVARWLAEGI